MEKVEAPYRIKCDQLAKVISGNDGSSTVHKRAVHPLLLHQEAESAQQNFVRQRRELEELQSAHRSLVGCLTVISRLD